MQSKLGFVFASALAFSSASAYATNCFKADETPQFQILEQAPPPNNNAPLNYSYFPATMIATMRIDLMRKTKSTIPQYYWQWANHGPRRVEKSNLAIGIHPGVGTSILFTSIKRANACTMAQTAALFGDNIKMQAAIVTSGLQQTANIVPGTLTDVCPLQGDLLPERAEGVLLDYEVIDGRTPNETRDFLFEYANYVHLKGKKAILYTNPLNAATQKLTGIDLTNASSIANAFDRMSVFLWSKNRERNMIASFEAQKAIVQPWRPDKMMVVFELNNTTLQDAADVGRLMKENSIHSVSLWRNYATQGGSCDLPINVKIACLAFGRC